MRMYRNVLTNLGFLLQLAGIFAIFPTGTAFYLGEKEAAVSFLITALVFLAVGFFLNSLSERKELDFKASSALLVIVFLMLGLFGSIPYLYLGVFGNNSNPLNAFTNSFFQSISGYTSTGLNLIQNVESLPRSLVLYMSLTQWVGGLGIVFLLLVFFYPERKLEKLKEATNVASLSGSLRKSFLGVLEIYLFYTIAFFAVLVLLGLSVVNSLSLVFSGLSTGGFSPVSDLSTLLTAPVGLVVSIVMLFGGISFAVHYNLLRRKFREAVTVELVFFLSIIVFFSILLAVVQQINLADSFFHVISASTTTGFSYMKLTDLNASSKMIFILLMFVGGSAFSTAGGIKVWRIIIFLKSIPWTLRRFLRLDKTDLQIGKQRIEENEIILTFSYMLLAIASIVIFSFVFTLYGFSLIDSAFEVTAALGTVGLSIGVTNVSLPAILKWLLIIEMILGRVEIMSLLALFVNLPRLHVKNLIRRFRSAFSR